MRLWLIDWAVWLGLVVIFAVGAILIVVLTQPPTYEQQVAAAESATLRTCETDPNTLGMPLAMRGQYCQCIVARSSGFGGLSMDDANTCAVRASRAMVANTDLEATFNERFPATCGRFEGEVGGVQTNGVTPFCQCLQAGVMKDRSAMASYAFAGLAPDDDAQQERVRACGSLLLQGRGWIAGTGPVANMEINGFLGAFDLRFSCADENLIFEALAGNGQPIEDQIAFFDSDGADDFWITAETGHLAAPASYALLDEMIERSEFDISIALGERAFRLTLSDLTAAADKVLEACPELAAGPAPGITVSTAPDLWEALDSGWAAIKQDPLRPWSAGLVCESSPPYLSLQHVELRELIASYPDPEGTFLAAGVPVSIRAGEGHVISEEVVCDWGLEEGAEESCFITLDRQRLDNLYAAPDVTLFIAGQELGTTAFGGSAALAAVRNACYRYAGT